MADLLKYPIGIQYFPDIIEGGYTYIDKTGYIRTLLDGSKYYFLSRPRRFGKSLFVSTLESFFQGRGELFKGLAIDTPDTVWEERPVITISLNTIDPHSEDALRKHLSSIFREYEKKFDIEDNDDDLSSRFTRILRIAFENTGKKVAVLIDEYDGPILDTLEMEELNNSFRMTLKSIFSVLKSADKYIHFAFVTGISRFSHTSLFSGANNLEDISLLDEFAGICGITEQELQSDFMTGIGNFAERKGITPDAMLALLKENYDGYHFTERCPDIYNPFSLLCALKQKKISDFWFRAGTPSFLINALRRDDFFLPELDCIEVTESDLSAKESYLNNPVSLLFESGYVTIRHFDEERETFTLGLPNKEVAESFSKALLPVYSGMSVTTFRNSFMKMRNAILDGNADLFMQLLKTFLQGNPYGNTRMAERETYFKNNIYLIFKALGFMPRSEEQTCNARMDVMLRTPRFIYIFELKTNGSVDKAMNQIDERSYSAPYMDERRRIIRIAANYSTKINNIDSWEIQE
ncbi:MAG: ATP-binding protein [Muribaculaceae bacterium]|nr:ATP-binding protein [Muribaculaceae bacterium]